MIHWHVIPYKSMPYATVVNWEWKGWHLYIFSACLSKLRYEFLILAHETVEAILCGLTGVSEQSVTDFDVEYERNRERYTGKASMAYPLCYRAPLTKTSEPGDDPAAPYHRAHRVATWCERLLARVLLVDWNAYETEVENLR